MRSRNWPPPAMLCMDFLSNLKFCEIRPSCEILMVWKQEHSATWSFEKNCARYSVKSIRMMDAQGWSYSPHEENCWSNIPHRKVHFLSDGHSTPGINQDFGLVSYLRLPALFSTF